MRIAKALIPAVLLAGMAALSLTGCVEASLGDTNSTSNPTNDNFSEMPREVPYLPDSVVTKATTSGNDASGDYTADVETTSSDAAADAEEILEKNDFSKVSTHKYENSKYTVTLSGSGSKVKYQLDRK
ncbi:hypothetical protein [Leifsonia shinshuensis]|uniref:hypothetical protein n=1 Tax=Leifsonia shinshuensis TaxID=150026 RepID=UPI0028588D0B|nr:hypothetical protein [Leifsonia shinshuensis]MDR6971727.1 hypothetical protein [Leifsonia shinshuensis]